MQLFGKHRVRSAFYHIGALVFIGITVLQFLGIVSESFAYMTTALLFVVDYLAEMFDPHPDNMGTWYERYFHRIYEDDTE